MYKLFIGSDISKEVIDVAYYDQGKSHYLGAQFSNDIEGFEQVVQQLKKITDIPLSSWFVCFENTGVYSKPLLEWLFSQGIPCREENALKIFKSLGLRRGKDDKTDAMDICTYAFEKRDSIKPSILPKPLIVKLKKLLSRRDLLVKQKKALDVSLKEQKQILDTDLLESLEKGNEILIKEYKKQIKEVEALMEQLIGEDPEAKENHVLAQSVVGVGPITSATFIAYTHNYKCFTDGRKFACYSGVAPFPNRSGKRIGKTKVSHMANKRIKSLLSNVVNAAVMHDQEISIYYHRKIGEGKEKGIVLNAIKNKIIHRTFAVINRKTPYVRLMNYAS